jgi:uncharacterized protein YfdQ (DUF2303 family)
MEDQKMITEVRDLTREAAQPINTEAIHFALLPTGMTQVSLEEYQFPDGRRPDRILAHPQFKDSASFCSYVNTFKDHRTRIFADPEKKTFTAALDYHGAGEMIPEFLSHRAGFTLSLSDQWNAWIALNAKQIPQATFAEFIEDNRRYLVSPDSATMLEVVQDLEAHIDVNFASKINRQNGSARLSYDEVVKGSVANGTIEIPENFTIGLPVFFGEASVQIEARLRFRVSSGKLNFEFKFYEPNEIMKQAFDVARGSIAAATTLEVLLGSL